MLSLNELLTRYSTWVVFAITGAAYWWLQLDAEAQKALLAAYPWLKQVAPLAGLVTFLAARAKRQGAPAAPPDFADTESMERPTNMNTIRSLAAGLLAVLLVACASVSPSAQIDMAYTSIDAYVNATQSALARGRITRDQALRAAANADEALSMVGRARAALAGCSSMPCPAFTSAMQGAQPALLELEKELRRQEAAK